MHSRLMAVKATNCPTYTHILESLLSEPKRSLPDSAETGVLLAALSEVLSGIF